MAKSSFSKVRAINAEPTLYQQETPLPTANGKSRQPHVVMAVHNFQDIMECSAGLK